MSRFFLIFASVLLFVGCGHKDGRYKYASNEDYNEAVESIENEDDVPVWISTSPRARAYHIYEDCYYLNKTTYHIYEMTQEEAIDKGRHLCHFCAERMIEEK